jgi:V/A-type H+-transporting ATPase subunit D
MALLAARAQLALARQGQALLEQKRDALLRELYHEVRVIHAARDELEERAAGARLVLEEARVRLGDEVVASAAAAARDEPSLELRAVSVMGIAVPAVEPRTLVREPAARGRDPAASGPALELAAQRFEEELTVAVRLATVEARVRRLAREIRRTSSRVNALRTRIVPSLERETRAIRLALEQHEREDHFRLKRVKAHRAA